MSKTCGECRFYFKQADFCRKNDWPCIEEDNECCDEFELLTNRDRVNEMSNERFIDFVMLKNCPTDRCTVGVDCQKCWLDWLNAPAESEGKDERVSELRKRISDENTCR